MEDAVTEPPPPSRFFEEDLDNFSPRSPSLPLPFLLQNPRNPKNPNPLLIIAISPPSLSLLRSIPNQTLTAALFLPEHPLLSTSPIQIHSSPSPSPSLLLASVPCHVSPSRSRAVARLLLDAFPSDRVLVLDSIRAEGYRGRLSAEEASAFKLETGAERKGKDRLVTEMEYLGSGSVADGLGAAVMAECEMRRRKGTMVVTWPEDGRDVVGVLMAVAKGLGIEVREGFGGGRGGFVKMRSDLYL